MNKQFKYIIALVAIFTLIIFSCEKKDKSVQGNDTITEGNVSMLVDESILPIVEDQIAVFENSYDAKITLKPFSEAEAILSLTENKERVAFLSRTLNDQENAYFKNKKIVPKVTKFATDAIVLIKSKKSKDTLISVSDIVDFLKGKKNGIKGLVFDNPNSSTVRYFKELAKVETLPENGIFSFKTNNEVIKYVEKNDGLIGVVGLNWLYQPDSSMLQSVENVTILSVKNAQNQFVYPSQDNIASNKYPLARDLYIINCQGYQGLGVGITAFISGDVGQRIILKSGLVPVKMPGRNIIIRNQIDTK